MQGELYYQAQHTALHLVGGSNAEMFCWDRLFPRKFLLTTIFDVEHEKSGVDQRRSN